MPQTQKRAARNPWLQYLRSVSQGCREAGGVVAEAVRPHTRENTNPGKGGCGYGATKAKSPPQRESMATGESLFRQGTLLPFAADAPERAEGASQPVG